MFADTVKCSLDVQIAVFEGTKQLVWNNIYVISLFNCCVSASMMCTSLDAHSVVTCCCGLKQACIVTGWLIVY